MWYSLILLLIVFSGEVDADGGAGCPYDFDLATGLIPSTCYPNYTGPDPANCCWFVSAAYLYAGILHSNATGEAFLPRPAASACSVAFAGHLLARRLVPRSFVSEDRCSLNSSSFSAGSRPCLWPSVSSIASAVSLSRPSQACTQRDLGASQGYCTGCQNQVINMTLSLLETTKSKEFVPCGMAATIGIWYRTPNPIRFRSYVLCLVQVLDNVPTLGTADLIPSPPTPPPPPISSSPESSSPNSLSPAKIAAAAVSASIAAVCAVFLSFLIFFRRRRRRKRNAAADDGLFSTATAAALKSPKDLLPVHGMYIFTPKELAAATGGFGHGGLLGEGGAGRVYLGTLPSGQRVAVKRIYLRRKVEEFYREVEILARLRHRRLATLVGYCLHPRELALVYEYMPGGSLAGAIRSGGMTWPQRVRVAADVAEGLAYLHSERVVHRDVKPGNVLLDESWSRAKLSDFGVSRVVPAGQTHLSTDLKGTMGYVDPESFPEGHVSESTDMFSFGVVLLELVTGKRAVEPTVSGGAESIVYRFKEEDCESRIEDVVDPRVAPEADMEAVGAVFALARACVRPSKHDRPSAADALVEFRRVLIQMGGMEDEKEEELTSIELSSEATSSQISTPPPQSQSVRPWSL